MTRYYRRRKPGRDENLRSAALGLAVGVVAASGTFYLARLFLGRELLGSPPPDPRSGARERPETGGEEGGPKSGEGHRVRTGGPVPAGRAPNRTGRSAGP